MGALGVVLLGLLGLWAAHTPEFAEKEPPAQGRT